MINKFSSPRDALKAVYGYDSFRDGQEEVIDQIMEHKDGLFVRATGGGKSMTYQIPALCKQGTAIVISPLIALMKDQVEDLNKKGVSATFINSSLSTEEAINRVNGLVSGDYKIFYVAPERLKNDSFVEAMASTDISFFAIDEAHCVSTWGQDFRPSYRKIKSAIEKIEEFKGKRIQRYACTATATELIRKDIVNELGMTDSFEVVGGFDRPNIDFFVKNSYSKTKDLIDICKQDTDGTIIVYCPTIKNVESIGKELVANNISSGIYHGKLPSEVKNKTQDMFINNQLKVIVATNAFGMGVDKENVRTVIHTSIPANIENYYQEAGRAGRDGKKSKAVILYNEKDRGIQEFFLECSYPDAESIRAVQVFLSSFDNGVPINFTSEEIAMISPDNIKEYQVNSILRILEEQDVIKTHNFEMGTVSPAIEVINSNIELDLSYLKERKRNANDSLNIMDRYAKSKRCLREFILDYFDEQPESKHCGKCGTCYSNELEKGNIEGVIPEEGIRAALSLTSEFTRAVTEKDLVDLLIGTNSKFFTKRGLDTLQGYGSLSNWTRNDVDEVVSTLISSDYLYCSPRSQNAVILTPKGEALLSQPKISMVKSNKEARSVVIKGNDFDLNDDNRVKSTAAVLDHNLYESLTVARVNLSREHEKPPFMIISDSTMKSIAYSNPKTSNDLIALGMTAQKVKLYGQAILAVVDKSKNEFTDEMSMNMP